ncbi:MAG: transporter substrate-binding domain-containing protein [Moorea sp. SIO3C2]|nr:transporter substrate-binding domain-containing protein [Moorena sp. SIO3C2]
MLKHKLFNFGMVFGLTAMSFLTPLRVRSAQLEEIEQRGQLIVGVKDNLRPLGYRDADGKLQGLEIDLARRLAEELLGDSDAVVLQQVGNIDRLKVVLDGEVDLTIARVTATAPRRRLVDFSIPYYLDGTGLITKDPLITRLGDLHSRTIAILNNSTTIAVVQYALPESRVVGVDSYQEARSLLENGRADAFAADNSILSGWVQDYPEYRMLPVWLSGEALCVVMPKGLQYTKLKQRVNNAIARWQADGWLAQRATAWGLPLRRKKVKPYE